MRRRLMVILTVVFLAVAMLAAVPADAAPAPVGTRVNLIAGTPTTLPANTPLNVIHGWGVTPNLVQAVGQAEFRLDVDGVDQGRGSLLNTGAAGGGVLGRLWLYNFANGFPQGMNTFTGHWLLPCNPAVAAGLFPGPCPTPNAQVEVFTFSVAVTFT